MLKIAITGGAGSGKSTVARMFIYPLVPKLQLGNLLGCEALLRNFHLYIN